MPEVVGLAILTAVGQTAVASTAIIGSVTVASAVGTGALIAGSVALQLLGQQDKAKTAGYQYSSRQSIPARRKCYGQVKLSGPYVAWDTSNGAFLSAIYLCEGPIESFQEIWLDDRKTPLTPDAAGQVYGISGRNPWRDCVTLEGKKGLLNQTPSFILTNGLPYWTNNFYLNGIAYLAQRADFPGEEEFKDYFPSGTWPQTRAVINSSVVRDVRDPAQTANPGTWKYTSLAGPCIYDMITHPTWGLKVPYSMMDEDSFKSFNALCEQKITEKDGTVRNRYEVAGTVDLTQDPSVALQGMLDACDGRLFLTLDGKIGISGGRYVAPTVTVNQSDVVSIGSLQRGNGRRATFNRLKTSHVSPRHDYQQVEGDPWDDLQGQADAGETLEMDFSRPWVPWHNQLRRLAKIFTSRQNPRYRLTDVVCNRGGLPAVFEDEIILKLPRYGISAPFAVTRAVLREDEVGCVLDLVSVEPDAYAFDADTEEGSNPPLSTAPDEVPAPGPPQNLTVTAVNRAVSGGSVVYLRLTCTEPARPDYRLAGWYRKVGTTAWTSMTAENNTRGAVVSGIVDDGGSYEVQGWITGYDNSARSTRVAATNSPVTATADPVAPAAPTYTSATKRNPGTDYTSDHVAKSPASANVRQLRLYRVNGHLAPFSAAALLIDTQNCGPNQSGLTLQDNAGELGLLRYYLSAVNGSGVESAKVLAPADLMFLQQVGNLLTSPNDLSNPAWVKTRVTATLSGNAPDGSPNTLVNETATTGGHTIEQSASITSGSVVQIVMAVKSNGRNRGTLYLANTDASSTVRAAFDLGAGTVSSLVYVGTQVTNATVKMIKVSADTYLLVMRGAVASPAARSRLFLNDDAGALSYAGDAAKGMYVAAATLAVV